MKKIKLILLAFIFILSTMSFAACREEETPRQKLGYTVYFTLINNSSEYAVSGLGTHNNEVVENVIIPATYNGLPVTEIANGGLQYSKINTITIPDSIIRIGKRAFIKNTTLTKITIPSSVTDIGESAFYECENLTEVIINGKITTLEERTFQRCISLIKITLPDSLLKINQSAFSDCSALENIIIPKNVTEIANLTFANCVGLSSAIIPNSVTKIITGGFINNEKLTVYAEPSNKPSGWANNWNYDYRPVFLGCTLSEDKSYVISFINSSDSINNPDECTFSAPYREGFTFGGWSLTEGGMAADYDMTNVDSAPNTTLYAIWIID